MAAKVSTVSFHGIDVKSVYVEVQVSSGLPAFVVVGLPDKAVAESRERVRGALHALGLSLPPKRLIVNLAPADLSKEGTHFDLPIALGMLAAMEIISKEEIANFVVMGELGLDASIRPVSGVLPAAIHAAANDSPLICPEECGREAAWAGGKLDILAPQNLLQLINHIKGTQVLSRPEAQLKREEAVSYPDLESVKGQETARRALEITAAGGHNLMMCGPPGSGKSLLASCLAGILPPLLPREALEVSMIHSLAGTLPAGGLLQQRPYRAPHHSASQPALIGGGIKVRPGEISLAHHGVLFLDELPEFQRATLEALRQPLETGNALVARANAHIVFPARFQLIAAMNPCRCGYLGDPERECSKAPRCAGDYQARISGPLLDRIDLQVDVPPVLVSDLARMKGGEPSAVVAARVQEARDIQMRRYQALAPESGVTVNARADGKLLEGVTPMSEADKSFLTQAVEAAKLSARAYYRILRVARTIADLNGGAESLSRGDIAEALSYRRIF